VPVKQTIKWIITVGEQKRLWLQNIR